MKLAITLLALVLVAKAQEDEENFDNEVPGNPANGDADTEDATSTEEEQ